jgi:hypothetical protein
VQGHHDAIFVTYVLLHTDAKVTEVLIDRLPQLQQPRIALTNECGFSQYASARFVIRL